MKSTAALKINTDGEIIEIDLGGDTLGTLQAAVDGWVQAVDLSPTLTMWLNEEGKILDLPHNPKAQEIWERFYGKTDFIVGDIVLTGGVDSQGDTLGIKNLDEIRESLYL